MLGFWLCLVKQGQALWATQGNDNYQQSRKGEGRRVGKGGWEGGREGGRMSGIHKSKPESSSASSETVQKQHIGVQ